VNPTGRDKEIIKAGLDRGLRRLGTKDTHRLANCGDAEVGAKSEEVLQLCCALAHA